MTLHKNPILWHEANLKNMETSLKNYGESIKNEQLRYSRLENECNKLRRQIEKAKRLNLTEFDKEEAKMNKDL